MVSVMLISVLNIKLTCEWHKAIKLNHKNTRTHVIVVLRVTKHFTCAGAARNALEAAVDKDGKCAAYGYYVTRTRYSTWTRQKITLFSGLYLRNRSTLDIGVLGYIGIHKEHSPEVLSIPPGTPCIIVLFTVNIKYVTYKSSRCVCAPVSPGSYHSLKNKGK